MTDPISKEIADSIRSQYPQKSIRQIAKAFNLSRADVNKILFPESQKADMPTAAPKESSPGISATHALLILFASVFLVYSNSLFNEFVWDDAYLIVGNPAITSLKQIPSLFFQPIIKDALAYRPLQIVFYSFQYAVWGLNPFGYHFFSVLLHAIAACLVFIFLCAVTKKNAIALVSSLLFAIHPLHTGAVSYISGQDNLLVLVFVLLCLITHRRAGDGFNTNRIIALLTFFCALLSKEIAIFTLPLIIFHDTFIEQKTLPRIFRQRHIYLYLILALLYLLLHHFGSAKPATGLAAVPLDPYASRKNFILASPEVMLIYLKMFFWPHPLCMVHYLKAPIGFFDPRVFLSVGFLAALVVVLWKESKRSAWILFGWGWFIIWYLPFSNIFVVLNALLAEHWMYVPSVGFIFSVVCIVDKKLRNLRLKQSVLLGFLSVFSWLTFHQNFIWKNDEIFLTHTVKYAPDAARMWNNLGSLYYGKEDFQQAHFCFQKALKLMPDLVTAQENDRKTLMAVGATASSEASTPK